MKRLFYRHSSAAFRRRTCCSDVDHMVRDGKAFDIATDMIERSWVPLVLQGVAGRRSRTPARGHGLADAAAPPPSRGRGTTSEDQTACGASTPWARTQSSETYFKPVAAPRQGRRGSAPLPAAPARARRPRRPADAAQCRRRSHATGARREPTGCAFGSPRR
jgi:hypothetical protein